MNQDDQRRCDAWGREKARMNRMNQACGRGVLVPFATAEESRPAWRARGEFFQNFEPTDKKNAACASSTRGLLSVVRCI